MNTEEKACNFETMQHNDGNIRKSIEVNGERFELSPQLIRILENSLEIFDK